jgi:hypothetical protein
MPGWRTPCHPAYISPWRRNYGATFVHISKKGLIYSFIKKKLFLITTTTNLLIKSCQHLNLLQRHVHQVVHVFLAFQYYAAIFKGISLKDLVLLVLSLCYV